MGAPVQTEAKKFRTRSAWRRWLADHHATSGGMWLLFAKKGSGIPSVAYVEAVEEALCFGWIDAQVKRVDEFHYMQRFTPRREGSLWSAVNRARAVKLMEEGKVHAAGLAAIERAKKNGRWEAAYSGAKSAKVTAELAAAFAAHQGLRRAFETLPARDRYALSFRLQTVKRPETRARLVREFVEKFQPSDKKPLRRR